ncbi:hypothetical protein [Flavimarina sp. Hel_I_48]|uniref:hypothetical protein n=1 Tax=Flavimarina sp. Hel_I_48 TaxID=1392488 RepID=UPI0013DAF662|nr:hypothetical protein [Flavimarina sp. Hel_I_48]
MSTPEKSHNNEDQNNKTSLKEQAINKEKTQGKDINHQVKEQREQHQPRDTA